MTSQTASRNWRLPNQLQPSSNLHGRHYAYYHSYWELSPLEVWRDRQRPGESGRFSEWGVGPRLFTPLGATGACLMRAPMGALLDGERCLNLVTAGQNWSTDTCASPSTSSCSSPLAPPPAGSATAPHPREFILCVQLLTTIMTRMVMLKI